MNGAGTVETRGGSKYLWTGADVSEKVRHQLIAAIASFQKGGFALVDFLFFFP